jgi:osmotically-inducible protein OsmY
VVNSISTRQIVTENAMNVTGVWAVNNLTEIRPTILYTDSAIHQNVAGAIILDPFLNNYDIIINVLNGTVQITGSVNNYFERNHATEVIEQIEGVTEVLNGLVVVKNKYRRYNGISPLESYYENQWEKTDFQLYNDITDRIFWNPEIHQGDISVEVIHGHVTLRGIVDFPEHRSFAEQVAAEEGALTVINKIDVRNELRE